MGDAEAARGDLVQRLKPPPSPATSSSCSSVVVPEGGAVFFRHGGFVRPGIPPSAPSPSPPFHFRSLSRNPTFSTLGSSSPNPIPPPFDSAGLPPRNAHRRSQSDVPIGFFQSASPSGPMAADGATSAMIWQQRRPLPPQKVKQEAEWEKETESSAEGKSEGDTADDLFNAYMNLDALDASGMEEKHGDLDSNKLSGTRTSMADSSENEAESSSMDHSGDKRSVEGDLNPVTTRHFRSLSMDSLSGKLRFGDEPPQLLPSSASQTAHHSRSDSLDGTANVLNSEFLNTKFNSVEIKKIMANEKLAEMALADPRRVKRILANRQSAARSKERKMRYISELEQKVQTLQTEATTLSARLTLLQRDSTGLSRQNNELRIRLQAMEQQAQLRDAINETLNAEVQRLKLATSEITESNLSKNVDRQAINAQIFPPHQLQLQQQHQVSAHIPLYHFQSQQHQQQQQSSAGLDLESKK
ncbi:bZIP transcription factor 29-like [Zingiber officinale]|uniref:BZIP domain-containing protein n=1 Tax=Zingiber officinale TaxID=94328 RepID=A0A8J5L0A2_ZINOF|nr:bZIP transcription factor 29-like [Zingiber officinale]KAG6496586.1 hypothetical protein ZIOFF_044454 [Zingiber officinale]